jgi:hypothetical protein
MAMRSHYVVQVGQCPTRKLVREISLRRNLAEAHPSEEALFSRFARNFTGIGVPKGEHLEELNLDLAISPAEAGEGPHLYLGVPIARRCPLCAGRGCAGCEDQGFAESERPVEIHLPAMAGAGTTLVTPLSGLGIQNLYLRVRVRVDLGLEPPM